MGSGRWHRRSFLPRCADAGRSCDANDSSMAGLRDLTRQFAREGRVEAIFLRPARGVPAVCVDAVTAIASRGLVGDRTVKGASAGIEGSKRQVTLVQAEHVPLIASWIGQCV